MGEVFLYSEEGHREDSRYWQGRFVVRQFWEKGASHWRAKAGELYRADAVYDALSVASDLRDDPRAAVESD